MGAQLTNVEPHMHLAAMLTSIKKIVVYLSGMCVALIVVEECIQRIHRGSIRLHPSQLESSQSFTSTSFQRQSMPLDSPPPNPSYNVSKHIADVTIDEEQELFADSQSKSLPRSFVSIHRNDYVPVASSGREEGVKENISTENQVVENPESDILELEDELRLPHEEGVTEDKSTRSQTVESPEADLLETELEEEPRRDLKEGVTEDKSTRIQTVESPEADLLETELGDEPRRRLKEGVTEDKSTRIQTVESSEADLLETELEEERRLRKSPFIHLEDHVENTNPASTESTSVKLVSYFRPDDAEEFLPKSFRPCPYKCRYVRNMSLADAVLFQASKVRDHIIPDFYRPPAQRWVFFTSDPAIKQYNLDRPDAKSQFNWTMTYQMDSDVPSPFGYLQRRKPPMRDYEALFDRKSKMAAWFVSHCLTWSQRELYVTRMRKIMQVDIFGRCGNLSCGPIHYRQNDSTECLPMLSQQYKFYLAFENAFCKDYLSEKFFKLFDNVDVVPVVRGGFDYKRYLPSGIFVDASDFKSPEELARYLLQLGSDKEKYVAMLRKKSQWRQVVPLPNHCRVCQALYTSQNTTHYHSNLKAKFNGIPSNCWQPTDLD